MSTELIKQLNDPVQGVKSINNRCVNECVNQAFLKTFVNLDEQF